MTFLMVFAVLLSLMYCSENLKFHYPYDWTVPNCQMIVAMIQFSYHILALSTYTYCKRILSLSLNMFCSIK